MTQLLCPLGCGKTFTRTFNLNRHVQNVHQQASTPKRRSSDVSSSGVDYHLSDTQVPCIPRQQPMPEPHSSVPSTDGLVEDLAFARRSSKDASIRKVGKPTESQPLMASRNEKGPKSRHKSLREENAKLRKINQQLLREIGNVHSTYRYQLDSMIILLHQSFK